MKPAALRRFFRSHRPNTTRSRSCSPRSSFEM